MSSIGIVILDKATISRHNSKPHTEQWEASLKVEELQVLKANLSFHKYRNLEQDS